MAGIGEVYGPAEIVAAVVLVLLYVIECAYLLKHSLKKRVNKKVERAKELGHVVKAYKIRGGRTSCDEPNEGTYEYTVDGKKYRYYFRRYDFAVP